jgi:hypothetical protein
MYNLMGMIRLVHEKNGPPQDFWGQFWRKNKEKTSEKEALF